MITLIVFSKDRAMQLDSLLQSVRDFCTGIDCVSVIAAATMEMHAAAYERLAHQLAATSTPAPYRIEFVLDKPENRLPPLGTYVAKHAANSQHIALAVDDMTFYRPSDFAGASQVLDRFGFVWSWRLGIRHGETMLGWETIGLPKRPGFWQCSPFVDDPDYRYLFHTDGALYRTADYTNMLDKWLPYWKTGKYTPNDLEAAVAMRRTDWAPLVGPHLGPLKPTCITWQLNRVQTKYGSPAAEVPGTNTDVLAQMFLDGRRVDNKKLYEMLDADPLRFNPPGARPTHVYACEEASRFWVSCVK